MSDRPIIHGYLQTIRGMCMDERPYVEIDRALGRAVEMAKDLEEAFCRLAEAVRSAAI